VRIVARLRETCGDLCDVAPSPTWWYFSPRDPAYVMPAQGWKLHVSATLGQAPQVLDSVADLLIQHATAWKVCRDIEQLTHLYSVPSAVSQVGKFITVYPKDEQESLDLAAELHLRTSRSQAPACPRTDDFGPTVSSRIATADSLPPLDTMPTPSASPASSGRMAAWKLTFGSQAAGGPMTAAPLSRFGTHTI
jgi:hypothetical protein